MSANGRSQTLYSTRIDISAEIRAQVIAILNCGARRSPHALCKVFTGSYRPNR